MGDLDIKNYAVCFLILHIKLLNNIKLIFVTGPNTYRYSNKRTSFSAGRIEKEQ
jgi:hypothetical protein